MNAHPRNVRNFWVDVDVDGRRVSAGPRSADGEIDLTIYQRMDGGVVTALCILGRVLDDGRLLLRAYTDPSSPVSTMDDLEIVIETRR